MAEQNQSITVLARAGLKADEVAQRVGVSRRTICRMVKRGQFPQGIRVGSAIRWPRATVDNWEELTLQGSGK